MSEGHFSSGAADRVLAQVDAAAGEIVDFTCELIRIPMVNPPGEAYADCAELIGGALAQCGFDVRYLPAEGLPEHTAAHPRVNVVGRRNGRSDRPRVHLNGHFDVVPAGGGWTVDPFGGIVSDGRIYGRGACDMKAGIAAALFAAEAIRRAGIDLNGSIDISGTVDEESGGFAGVAWLADRGHLTAGNTDYVIIPEPLNVDRICVGHRGVYWYELTTHGRIAHGSMPFHGVSAIDHMSLVLDRVRRDILPALALKTTAMPVEPPEARHPTLNINGVQGGQPVDGIQTPCVADWCRAVLDRRFLIEEGLETARGEIAALLERVAEETLDFRCELRDLMIVHPVRTPDESPLIAALGANLQRVLGRSGSLIASPGTYDHKHVTRIGGIADCVAYGPGILDLAHQPDEWCAVEDLVNATKVIALTLLDLTDSR